MTARAATWMRAHPRVCGENARARGAGVTHVGSSPRVRGKLGATGSGSDFVGLIPACAGKTTIR